MKKIKRIGILSAGKMGGATYAFLGLVFGVIFAIAMILINLFSSNKSPESLWVSLLTIVLPPIIYGAMGFLLGMISSWIYNFMAKRIGGIEIEFGE